MKRLVAVLLSLVLSCSVAFTAISCGNKEESPNNNGIVDTDTNGTDQSAGTGAQPGGPVVTPPDVEVDDGFFDDEDEDVGNTEGDVQEPTPPPAPPVTEPTDPNEGNEEEVVPPPPAPPAEDETELPSEDTTVDIGSLVEGLVALPSYTITSNPDASFVNGAVEIGSVDTPSWLIPNKGWTDSDYGCTNPEHAKYLLTMTPTHPASAVAASARLGEPNYLASLLLDGVTAKDLAGNAYPVTLTQIDDTVVTEQSSFSLSAGEHTAVLQAIDNHGRTTLATRTFTVVAAPSVTVGADYDLLLGSTKESLDLNEGVSVRAYGRYKLEIDASAVNFNAAGTYPIVYTVSDSLGQTATATRSAVIRDYSKDEALALYAESQKVLAHSSWTTSATAEYKFGGNGPYYTHLYRENTPNNYKFGFAADSNYTSNLPYISMATTGYACVNDGAILFDANLADGTVGVKRTDPNYNGGYKEKASVTATSNLLSDFSPSLGAFQNVCTANVGTMSAVEAASAYGFTASADLRGSLYSVNNATVDSYAVSADGDRITLTFGLNAAAGAGYLTLLNAAMVDRWSVSAYKGATISYTIDRTTRQILATNVSGESFGMKVHADKVVWGGSGDYSADVSSYSYSETYDYSAVSQESVKNAAQSEVALTEIEALRTEASDRPVVVEIGEYGKILPDGSVIFADGSCSCAPDRFADVGSVTVDPSFATPVIRETSALRIPSPADGRSLYEWLYAGIESDEGLLVATAIRANGTNAWTELTASADLLPFLATGKYEVKYCAMNQGNYSFYNRVISIVALDMNLGTHIYNETAPAPEATYEAAFTVPASDEYTSEIFFKLLGKGIAIDNGASLSLYAIDDKDGNREYFDESFDYNNYIQSSGTYTVLYYLTANGNTNVFARTMNVESAIAEVGEEGSGYKDPNASAPAFEETERVSFSYDAENATIYAWLYQGVAAKSAEGNEVTLRPVGIKAADGETYEKIAKPSTFDYASVITEPGEYKVRYYAIDKVSGNFTYWVRTVTAYSVPKITINLDGQDVYTAENGAQYPVYYLGDASDNEAEKYLKGVTLTDPSNSVSIENITFEGSIDYSKPNFSKVTLSVTNEFGKTCTIDRYFYIRDYDAPKLSVSNDGLVTTTISGRSVVVFRYDTRPDLLAGVTVSGVSMSDVTVDDSEMNYTPGGIGKVKYTATNVYGKTVTATRYYYARDYQISDMNGDVFAIYNRMETVMDQLTYFVKAQGTSTLSTGGPLKIYTTIDHTPDEMYLESLSDGSKVFFVNTSFARRVYLKKNGSTWSGHFSQVDGQDNTTPIINSTWGYATNPWKSTGTAEAFTDGDFRTKFGRPLNQIFSYPISSSTVKESSISASNGNYKLKYVLDVSKDAATAGYKAQVNVLSGQTVTNVSYLNLEVIVSNDFRVISYQASEQYNVSTLNAQTSNVIDYKYYYDPDGFKVRSF